MIKKTTASLGLTTLPAIAYAENTQQEAIFLEPSTAFLIAIGLVLLTVARKKLG